MSRAEGPAGDQRWVLKLGSSTILAGTETINVPRLLDYVRCIASLRQSGVDVVLVSSGAVAAGRAALPGFGQQHRSVPVKQMLAAIGQPQLMALYSELFGHYGIRVAQILLSRTDFSNRRRYLNARNTLAALLEHRILPIINENDTVATAEIRVGDNDQLAALVANLIEARKLVLMTDVDGLFDANPKSQPDARLIETIDSAEIGPEIWAAAGGAGSDSGTGGMLTKLKAAEIARHGGADTHIANGSQPAALLQLLQAGRLGSCIRALLPPREARKRYVLSGLKPSAAVHIDAGAARALARGSSLLAVGVTSIAGEFERGDPIEVRDSGGRVVARGLSRYGQAELARIRGQRSDQFEALLGYSWGDELIHRNDLVLLGHKEKSHAQP